MDNEKTLEKIYKASIKLLIPQTIEETYRIIVHEAMILASGDYATILLENNGKLERVYTTHKKLESFEPRKKGLTYKTFKYNKAFIPKFHDVKRAHPELESLSVNSDIMIPLSYQNKAYGVLTVLSKKKNNFGELELKFLKLFGPLATLAIKKTQYFEETKEALETRDLFISIASHELKTPLTTVYAYMQLMQKKMDAGEELKQVWVNTLLYEVKRLTDLVNELLQVNRIQTGRLHFSMRKTNLQTIIKKALNNFSIMHKQRKIVYKNKLTKGRALIKADESKILQVITNLLNNAVKHSHKEKEIMIILADSKKHYIVTIKDKGEGISKKDLPKVFERFYKGQSSRQEGMGLGLYLVRKIIDTHGGIIDIDSELEKGTEVSIHLPKA